MSFGSDRLGSPGVLCGGHGIDRRLSGKPTFDERPFKGRLIVKQVT